MRRIRRGILVCGLIALMVVLTTGGAPHASAAPATRASARASGATASFDYTGWFHGEEDFYGFISPTKPYAKTGHMHWSYSFKMTCETEVSALDPGTQFGCRGPIQFDGEERITFTDPVVGKGCTGQIVTQPNATWSVGGAVLSRTKLHLFAAEPEGYATIGPADSACKGPNEAIHWTISPEVNWTGGLYSIGLESLFASGRALPSGEYVDHTHGPVLRGHVDGGLFLEVKFTPKNSPLQNILGWLAYYAHALGNTLDSMRDQLNDGLPDASGLLNPSVDMGTSGTLSGQGTSAGLQHDRFAAGAPETLFTIHKHVGTRLTPVPIQLTPAGRRYLATAGAAKIGISLTFKPTHGTATSLRRVVTMSPRRPSLGPAGGATTTQIASVTFAGSPANPSFVVHGTNLGSLPQPDPPGHPSGQNGCPVITGDDGYDYGTSLYFVVPARNWSGGRAQTGETDCIDLVVTKFTPTEVDFHFGRFYTQNQAQFPLNDGDQVEIGVNAAVKTVHVKYGATVTA